MNDNLIDGLDGLSKIESFSDVLFTAIYWIAIIFVILIICYIFAEVNCYFNRKRRGDIKGDDDDFLDD